MNGNDKNPVTVIGLGAMGSALARALVAAGHPTTVWNRTPGKAPEGANETATAAEAVAASPLTVLCVLDYPVAQDVAKWADWAGRTLVNLTNGTPQQADAMADWAAERGADYLDGGIMAVPPGIGTPHAMLLYSGSRTAFDQAEPVLSTFGAANYVGAEPGRAAMFDLALLTGMYGMFAGFVQAAAFVRKQATATELTELLVPWLAAMSGLLPDLARRVDSGDHTTDVDSPLGMQAAAFPNLAAACRANGVSPELLAPLAALVDRAVAAGHANTELSSLVDLL
ncbi:dehydrogenase (secreted protein) [Alloactinosynnema sp. L-07]|uniref:NAD(P)-dependent oxidoreductase n=1 Tax=Alloactinosynnema sp. L-07 TaxID=1653480 RepID=UPI00065EF6A4|nr:NAD(P)-binding domain-containing protein [Alloactinosynnema sp. L-07]CRK61000.1 dehydrogenase (secreted protein) [Alloactinosynnema sp. L-07]